MEAPTNDFFVKQYLEFLLQGNRVKCSETVHDYLKQNPSIMELYEQVLKVSLYEIGRLWETNKISVAAEHLATAITEGILNELFEQLISKEKFNKKVVLTCVENEQHQVGIKMVADMFEMKGWDSYFLGTGIPINELKRYIEEIKPDILAISLSIYFNYHNLAKMIEQIKDTFPELMILIGGQAFTHMQNQLSIKYDNVIPISDLYFLEQFINLLNLNQNKPL